jgi:hypothetical protein
MLFIDLLVTSDYRKLHVERVRRPTIRYLFGISYIMRAIEISLWRRSYSRLLQDRHKLALS